MSFKDKIDVVENGLKQGYIPKRITHNDTKLNNYLFDPITNEAVCLIDFDTIMVSSALYDYGDATRSMCNIVGSSETDLNKVLFDLNIYEAFTKGYLKVGKKFLTKKEIELIPYSSFLITFELCTRFLADYLQNDIAFPIKYEKHNLDRAKNQIKIVKDIICKMDKMADIVAKYIK